MTYLYDIGYGTHEESEYIQWRHDEKFTIAQLKEIVTDALCAALLAKRDPASAYSHERHPTFQDLMGSDTFISALVARGFSRVDFEASFYVFGWAAADVPGDWSKRGQERTLQEELQRRVAATPPAGAPG